MLDFGERGQLDCEKRLILASKKKKNEKARKMHPHALYWEDARVFQFCPHSYLSTETRHALRAI